MIKPKQTEETSKAMEALKEQKQIALDACIKYAEKAISFEEALKAVEAFNKPFLELGGQSGFTVTLR